MVAKLGNYVLKETLGKGSYSEVKLAVHEITGEEFAIKVMGRQALQSKHFEEEVKNEIRALQAAKHPNVVNIRKVLLSNKSVYIVMEIVRGGELFDRIVGAGRLAPPVARRYFQQIVDAVFYCHLQGVCHRDLKPENILLDDEDNVKITDFGLSKIVQFSEENGEGDGNHLVYTRCGTPRYMAPELLRRARDGYCGFKADIWSLGIILFAMLSGYLPFNGKNDDDLYNTVTTRDVYFPDFVPQDVRPLISQLLEKDPKKRIPLKQVREDPWFLIDYVEDDHVKDAKDKIKERCECGANNPSHNITSPRGEEMSPLSEVMVKKNTTDVNDSPTAPSSPVSSDGDEAPAATKERKKPAQLSVAVPSTNSSSALSPGGLKSPVVQRILSPTGAKDNTVAEDLINQHGLVNKVATVLTPRGKFMPSFLKGGDGSFRANREAAAGGDEDSIAPMTSEPSGAKRRHRLRVMTNSNARVSEASSKSRMRDNIAKVLSPRGGPGKQIPGGD